MKTHLALLLTASLVRAAAAPAPALPAADQRGGMIVTLDTPRTFPEIRSKAEWERRAREIREQALVSCGLWPLPEKTPLNAKIFGRVEREGYSVEKVYFQTYPGVYLAGNLYRPVGKGPFPAVLNPHGHWNNGRLEDSKAGSIPARCISFARQGMVAFSYDMAGYHDTQFAGVTNAPGYKTHRLFGAQAADLPWNISLMGLQTWNTIRALDFLESLPDVDKARLGCTGASGGGTQTFMLGAIDDRLAALAPCVMVSSTMQGGCSCENAPGLRVDFSNMEIAAAAAPRPQILVAATGDWTKLTMTVEGPAVEKVYRLFDAPDKLRYVRFDFNHNYNLTTREAVYEWFGRWLLKNPDPASLKEQPYKKEPDADLRVFPDSKLPEDAVTAGQLRQYLIGQAEARFRAAHVSNPIVLENYKKLMIPAWKRTLQTRFVETGLLVEAGQITKELTHTTTRLTLGRVGLGDRVPVTLITPRRDALHNITVLTHPAGRAGFLDANGALTGLAKKFVERNQMVLLVDTFGTGEAAPPTTAKARNYFANFYTTYNRTEAQERVQDIVTACAFAQSHGKGRKVVLCGVGRAGLWTLLAAPAADLVVADCDALKTGNDEAWLAPDIFVPGLRNLGGFEGVAMLNATNPLLLHNTGKDFSTATLRNCFQRNKVPFLLREEAARLDDDAIVDWVLHLRAL